MLSVEVIVLPIFMDNLRNYYVEVYEVVQFIIGNVFNKNVS